MATSVNVAPKAPVKIIDAKHFSVVLDQPSCCFLAILPQFEFGILDSVEAKKHATAADPWATDWVGKNAPSFGPYQVDSFAPGESLTLTANPNYFQAAKGIPAIKTIRFRAVPDPGTRATLISAGEVDIVTTVPFDRLTDLAKSPNLKIDTSPTLRALNMFVDSRAAPFSNVDVRRAISLAINRETIAQSAFAGYAAPAHFVVIDKIPGPRPAAGSEYMKFDQTLAKKLLESAGASALTFKVAYNTGDAFAVETARAAQVMQQQLAAIGVKMELNPQAPAEYSKGTAAKTYTAWMTTSGPLVADASYDAKGRYYNAETSTNAPGFFDKDLVAAIDTAALGTANRDAALTQVYSILGQKLPAIIIVDVPNQYVFKKNVNGHYANPGQAIYLEYMKVSN
jgi:peptide/nickel transport system substrate-binding protein